jgi:transposase
MRFAYRKHTFRLGRQRLRVQLKQRRRVATRCDKPAANYLAFVRRASIRLWLRVNASTA